MSATQSQAQAAIDERALAQLAAGGDHGAFETIMRRHNRRLYRLARATLRDDSEAEDALQDAYVHAYRSLGQFRGESSLSTWLARLVLNECFGRLRRTARRQNVVPMTGAHHAIDLDTMPSTDQERPEASVARAEIRRLIERKLDELPEAFRVVFVLRSIEEMSVEDAAQCLGIPEATVRTRHFRAKALLRESLARELDLAEPDVFAFGGEHCDRVVAGVLGRLRAAPNA